MRLFEVTVTVDVASETRHVLATNIVAAMAKGARLALASGADPEMLVISAKRAEDGALVLPRADETAGD